ncbi:Hypothetical protein CINCED_3A011313 [Cinara cedri]|uniref:Uncharacterized protein n=1 Tax=Cinara cedri TaxID=506608 RepID=A0A5E4N5I0_9HEMI|nr:Hypothetical protein CINCED_3A011313 [Cinara cedri]
MRENRLEWFWHITRRENLEAVSIKMKIAVEEKKGRERSKNRWLDTVENGMRTMGVCENEVGDRVKWQFMMKVIRGSQMRG